MSMGGSTAPCVTRVAAKLILAAALFATPRAAPGAEPGARGRLSFQLGLGPATVGAPQILLGAGWAPIETGTQRLDLFLRGGFSQSREFHHEDASGMAADVSLQAVSLHLDVAAAGRLGRVETFAGGGVALVGTSGTLETWCRVELALACAATPPVPERTRSDVEGTSVWAAVGFGGLRVAVSDQFLVELELRYQQERRSRLGAVPISMAVGGYSGLLSATWRIPSGTPTPTLPTAPTPPPPTAPAPTPPFVEEAPPAAQLPAAPRPLPSACTPGERPTIVVHPARRFLCTADPVRGGHYCEPGAPIGQFVDLDACEAACRGGRAACSVGDDAGAACARCSEGCAATAAVPCPVEPGWLDGRPGCPLPAGSLGLEAERTVPATCTGR